MLSNSPWVTSDRLQSVLQLDGSMLRSMNAKSVSHSVLEELWELWKGLSGVDSSFLLLAVGVGRIGETSRETRCVVTVDRNGVESKGRGAM